MPTTTSYIGTKGESVYGKRPHASVVEKGAGVAYKKKKAPPTNFAGIGGAMPSSAPRKTVSNFRAGERKSVSEAPKPRAKPAAPAKKTAAPAKPMPRAKTAPSYATIGNWNTGGAVVKKVGNYTYRGVKK